MHAAVMYGKLTKLYYKTKSSIGGLWVSYYMRCYQASHPSTMVGDYRLSFFLVNLSVFSSSEVTNLMYEKILRDPLVFGPEIGTQARSVLTGLLTRDPTCRLGANGADTIKK